MGVPVLASVSRRATHSRVTDCAFTADADFVANEEENRWIGLYGEDNQIDRCTMQSRKGPVVLETRVCIKCEEPHPTFEPASAQGEKP